MTSQTRRRNGACLLRMRENCPFRKLRRNCCDSRSVLVPDARAQCRLCECPQSQTGPPVSKGCVNTVEAFCRPAKPDSRPGEEDSAMDTDMDPPAASSYTMSSTQRSSNIHHINTQGRRSSNYTVMGLDSGVDPETGEQAQG